MTVPIPPGLGARYANSSAGRAWIAALPGLVQGRLEHWELAPDLPAGAFPWHGNAAVVVPVRQTDGGAAALKVAFPTMRPRLNGMLWSCGEVWAASAY